MWVTLKFKTVDNKSYKCKKELTVKEATKLFKEKLQNDDKIVKAWLSYFDGWHYYIHKILKNKEK